MSTRFKLALFLVPAIAAIIWLVWWLSPTQVILRKLDASLELADISALRLTSPDQLPARIKMQVAPALEVGAPFPIPNGSFKPKELAEKLSEFHNNVAGCRVTREDALVVFTSPDEARVKTPIEVKLSWGRGSGVTRSYHAELRFTKSSGDWLLDQVLLKDR